LADTYAGWRGSFGEDVSEQRLARCVRESSLPAHELVARWVPVEFFTDASPAIQEEMAAVVAEFHPLGFRLTAKALADNDTTDLLPTIDVPTLLLWAKAIDGPRSTRRSGSGARSGGRSSSSSRTPAMSAT
jgi:hypothetical protein